MTYEYICKNCGLQFEAEQKITEEPLIHCEKCGHNSLKRLINQQSGFILKGSGWYRDGYGNVGKG